MRFLGVLFIASFLLFSCGRMNDYQKNIDLKSDWKFYPMDEPGFMAPEFDKDSWLTIDLVPNKESNVPISNQAIAELTDTLTIIPGWYRKTFLIEQENREKSIYLYFNGIFSDPELWLNQNLIGEDARVDAGQLYKISNNIHYDNVNEITIRVDSNVSNFFPSDLDWRISQEAKIVIANPVHIRPGGIDIQITDAGAKADLEIRIAIINDALESKRLKVISHIYHPEDGKQAVVNSGGLMIDDRLNIVQITTLSNPDMSMNGEPVIYECVTDILTPGNTILDTYVKRFVIPNKNSN
ncbi:MAG: hypothetical protein ACOCWA_00570 [Bacteroidota bacterium]